MSHPVLETGDTICMTSSEKDRENCQMQKSNDFLNGSLNPLYFFMRFSMKLQ